MAKAMTEEQRRAGHGGPDAIYVNGHSAVRCSVVPIDADLGVIPGRELWHHRTLTVSFLIILSAPVGVSIGWLHWRSQERRFAEPTAASSSLGIAFSGIC
jgi:hypothetical protein